MAQATSMVEEAGGSGVGRWALAGLVLYPVGWFASFLALATVERLVLEPLGLRPEAGMVSLSIRNGLHQIVWGVAVAVVAVPIGRRLVRDIRFDLAGVAVLAVGLVLAALTELLVIEFARLRYGYVDTDSVGLAILAPPAIVAVALAVWAAMAVPRPNRAALLLLAAVAALGLGLTMLPSIGGLSDGIDPESIGLAASLLGSAGFVVVGLVLARR